MEGFGFESFEIMSLFGIQLFISFFLNPAKIRVFNFFLELVKHTSHIISHFWHVSCLNIKCPHLQLEPNLENHFGSVRGSGNVALGTQKPFVSEGECLTSKSLEWMVNA